MYVRKIRMYSEQQNLFKWLMPNMAFDLYFLPENYNKYKMREIIIHFYHTHGYAL